MSVYAEMGPGIPGPLGNSRPTFLRNKKGIPLSRADLELQALLPHRHPDKAPDLEEHLGKARGDRTLRSSIPFLGSNSQRQTLVITKHHDGHSRDS